MKWSEAAQRYLQMMSSNVVSRALEFKNQAGAAGDGKDGRRMNFFRSLTTAEREAFAAVAIEQSFASGSRLMSEGEPANHVMVIIGGWTRITVKQLGGERIVAERGPGQLLGERAALRSNVRSATVTALSTVSALVMRTEDFASFISAHPRVLAVVEDQIYGRLTEDPKGYALDGWTSGVASPAASRVPSPRRRSPPLNGENCTIILTDVARFGGTHRDDQDRLLIRREGMAMMQATLESLWEACIWEDRGDGLLIVVPPHVPTWKVVECLHRALPARLRRHNRTYARSACFQLRVAVSVGPVTTDSLGLSGNDIIHTSRLVEAPVLKDAMPAAGYQLGVIVSEFVYKTAVRQSSDFIDISEYRKVAVLNKEFDSPAWMWLTDVSPHTRDTLNDTAAGLRAAGEWYSLGSLARTEGVLSRKLCLDIK